MLLIKDLNMPNNCCECILSKSRTEMDMGATIHYVVDCKQKIVEPKDGRSDYCPLIKIDPVVADEIFDKETTIHGCAVQILENTVTGKMSIGWWREGTDNE